MIQFNHICTGHFQISQKLNYVKSNYQPDVPFHIILRDFRKRWRFQKNSSSFIALTAFQELSNQLNAFSMIRMLKVNRLVIARGVFKTLLNISDGALCENNLLFFKKAPSEMFDRVWDTSLLAVNKSF